VKRNIVTLIDRFAQGAAFATRSRVHGRTDPWRHGYLIANFSRHEPTFVTTIGAAVLWPTPLSRLLCLQAVRRRVGADFPVGLKLTPKTSRAADSPSERVDSKSPLPLNTNESTLLEISGGTYKRTSCLARREAPVARRGLFRCLRRQASTALLRAVGYLTGGFGSERPWQLPSRPKTEPTSVGVARAMILVPDIAARIMAKRPIGRIRAPVPLGHRADRLGDELFVVRAARNPRIAEGSEPCPALAGPPRLSFAPSVRYT